MNHNIQNPKLSTKIAPKTVRTARGIVEYAEIGDGPVVVAVHGAMGGYDQSLILAQTIGSAGYRYIAVTRPGYLGTPIVSGKDPEQQGDLIAALLDELGVPGAGVMAVSGGGPSAVQFGIRHPDRCAGLILVSTCADKVDTPIPFSFKVMTFLARWPWFVERFRKKAEGDLAAVAERSISDRDVLLRTINDDDTWPLFSTMLLSTFDRMNQRLDGTKNDINITATATYPLERLYAPTLIIHGTRDQLVEFKTQTEIYKTRVPNVEILAVDGGEHVAIFTHREMVREKAAEFMRRYFI